MIDRQLLAVNLGVHRPAGVRVGVSSDFGFLAPDSTVRVAVLFAVPRASVLSRRELFGD